MEPKEPSHAHGPGLSLAASDFEAMARRAAGPLGSVSRHSARRVLYEWIERTRGGKGALLFLTGPPGSGKTRLARSAASHARRRGFGVYAGACGTHREPYAPFVEALRGALASDLDDGARIALESSLEERPELAELVRWGISSPGPAPDESVGTPALFQALAHPLLGLAAARPGLVVVEDLHLSDAATTGFLKYLGSRVRLHPLLLIVTCRTDEAGDLSEGHRALADEMCRRYDACHVGIGGLTDQETDDLIRSAYRKNLFSNGLRRGVQRATGGNPSAILEALRLFQEQGMIFSEAGIWKERRVPAEVVDALPDLYETVARRLEHLPPDLVHLLRLAAVSGSRFDPSVLEHALGVGHLPFLRLLGALRRTHGVFVPDGAHVSFSSGPLREAVLLRIPRDLLPGLHLSLAEAIERAHPGRGEEMVEALADHYSSAEVVSKAFPCLVAAGDRARRFSAFDRAAEYYERALSILGKAPGDDNGGVRLGTVLRKAAGAYIQMKRWHDAEAHLQSLLSHARQVGEMTLEAEAWKGLGRVYAKRKEFGLALALYRRSLERFREAGDGEGECDTLVKMGSVYLEQGHWKDLRAAYDRALGLARKLRNEDQVASISMNMAIMFSIRGEASRALTAYRRSLEIYRRLGAWDKVAAALLNIGKCLADQGDPTRARSHYLACLEIARKRHDLLHTAIAQLNLSEVILTEGDRVASRTMCEDALKRFEEIDHRVGMADACRMMGRLHGHAGEAPEAASWFEKSLSLNREVGYVLGEAEACRDYGELLAGTGSRDLALRMVLASRDRFLDLGASQEAARMAGLAKDLSPSD